MPKVETRFPFRVETRLSNEHQHASPLRENHAKRTSFGQAKQRQPAHATLMSCHLLPIHFQLRDVRQVIPRLLRVYLLGEENIPQNTLDQLGPAPVTTLDKTTGVRILQDQLSSRFRDEFSDYYFGHGACILVMEDFGENLRASFSAVNSSPAQRKTLLQNAAQTLARLHNHGFIVGDTTPEQFVVSTSLTVRRIDVLSAMTFDELRQVEFSPTLNMAFEAINMLSPLPTDERDVAHFRTTYLAALTNNTRRNRIVQIFSEDKPKA